MRMWVCLPVATVTLLALGLASCSAPKPHEGAKTESATDSKQPGGNVMRFCTWKYVDDKGIGDEVFRMLKPADWKVENTTRWDLDNTMSPATISYRMWNPNGSEQLEVFPNQTFFWTTNQGLLGLFPQGRKYFGREVRPSLSAQEAIKQIVLARFRKNVKNLRVVTAKPLDQFVQALGLNKPSPGAGITQTAEAAIVRIEYTLDGKDYEEDITGARESLKIPVRGMFETSVNDNWTLSFLTAMRAEKGKLDSCSSVYRTMLSSIKLNPKWFNRYIQIVEMLIRAQMQNIRMAGEFSRLLAQTNDEITAERQKTFEGTQSSFDHVSETFGDYMRDVDRYVDSDGKEVELPTGGKSAWVNGLGDYVVSEREDFNPNIGSNQHWNEMRRK